ncbi:hypothetical protein HDU76_007132 [Blyttiomyces sp. JEL0837]|nr:hypothetical protein HDU76_007132 [Blyttiomyces sp. JEL0837]
MKLQPAKKPPNNTHHSSSNSSRTSSGHATNGFATPQHHHHNHSHNNHHHSQHHHESHFASALAKRNTPTPASIHIRPSLCGQFTVVAERYSVPLPDGPGCIPMDRRCTVTVYGHTHLAKAAVLLIPGFASNRAVFDVGGGKGKTGPSFFEFLAQRGYDTYSIDLRGSRQSLRMGSKAPAFLKEHVEIDVPSAIKFIKNIGHEKVYLIGHSMGGAISCAVAGFIPEDVAGIVHLAGLYNYSLPYVGDIVDMYKAHCPEFVQGFIRAGAGFALRSALTILAPAISGLFNLLNPPQNLPAITAGPQSGSGESSMTGGSGSAGAAAVAAMAMAGSDFSLVRTNSQTFLQPPPPHRANGGSAPSIHFKPLSTSTASSLTASPILAPTTATAIPPPSPSLDLAPKQNALVSATYSFITELRRQPIPLRSVVELCLFLRRFVPAPVEKVLMNCMYPSPWLPYSVEDPWSIVERAAESPTVGIWLGIQKMAVQDEIYNEWLVQSSSHRAEVRQMEQSAEAAVKKASTTVRTSNIAPAVESKSRDEAEKPPNASTIMSKAAVSGALSFPGEGAHSLLKSTLTHAATSVASLTSVVSNRSGSSQDGGNGSGRSTPQSTAVTSPISTASTTTVSSAYPSPVSSSPSSPQVPPSLLGEKVGSKNGSTTPASASSTIPSRSQSTNSNTSNDPVSKLSNSASWNELGPYLQRFEQLEHLPLFFCHANADAVIRTEDTMAGYRRSGSKWKEVIEYVGEVKTTVNGKDQKPSMTARLAGERTKVAAGAAAAVNGTAASSVVPVAPPTNVVTPHTVSAAASSNAHHRRRIPSSMQFTPLSNSNSNNTSVTVETVVKESTVIESESKTVVISILEAEVQQMEQQPVQSGKSRSAPSSPPRIARPMSVGSPSVLAPPSLDSRSKSGVSTFAASATTTTTTKTTSASINAYARTSTVGNGDKLDPLKPRYAVPANYKYGHCDILGGKHAEQVWERIAEWLDATTAREKEWRFKRRYSAK